jgi:hypothetical protein
VAKNSFCLVGMAKLKRSRKLSKIRANQDGAGLKALRITLDLCGIAAAVLGAQ